MKYLKTYDNISNFFKKFLEPKDNDRYPAEFNPKEKEELLKLNFSSQGRFNLIFTSITSDKKISISKYYEELGPGYADSVFIYTDTDGNRKEFVEKFQDLLEYIESNIPEIEKAAKKYNL